jgi:zinc transport system permease protein
MDITMTPVDLLLPLGVAAAAGLVGSIAVMRRMTLASDALSHVALPGIGLALMLQVSPVLGGLAALLVGTFVVWAVEHRTRLPTEAIIGVVFSAALAVGALLASGDELLDALLGTGINVARTDLLFLTAFAVTVALGLRFLGVLLMGSLVIIPAATAKHLAGSLRATQLIAVGLAVTVTALGTLLGQRFGVAPGPLAIVLAAAIFFLSLLRRR